MNPVKRPIVPPAQITDRLVKPASQELFLTPQTLNAISVHMQLTIAQLAQLQTLPSNAPFVPLAFSSIPHPTLALLVHPIATTANFSPKMFSTAPTAAKVILTITSQTLAYHVGLDVISVILSTLHLTIAQIAQMDTLKCGTTTPSHSHACHASTPAFNAPTIAFVLNVKLTFS